jgi:hypothetical protein
VLSRLRARRRLPVNPKPVLVSFRRRRTSSADDEELVLRRASVHRLTHSGENGAPLPESRSRKVQTTGADRAIGGKGQKGQRASLVSAQGSTNPR